jgi:uncharacterized protein (DUF58 family)
MCFAPERAMSGEATPAATGALANVVELPDAGDGPKFTIGFSLPREGRLWLFAALLMMVTGLFKGINLLVLLAYLMLGVWAVNWRFGRRDLARLRGRRGPSGPLFAGRTGEIQVEVTCAGPAAARGITVEDGGAAAARRWLILRLEEGRPARLLWRQEFARRGRYAAGPLLAVSRFPFGLVCRSAELVPATEWVVLPRLGRVSAEGLKQWLGKVTRGDGRVRRRKLQPSLQEADFHGLRDYRSGDSPRWIHWRTSARRGQLLVREFEDSAPPDLVLIVEPWVPDRAAAADLARLEDLISLAASVCREWCRDPAARLTLVISRPGPAVLQAGAGAAFALLAMEALAVEEGHPAVPGTKWLDRLPRASQATPVLLLTSRAGSPLADEVAGFLGRPAATVAAGDRFPWYEPPVDSPEAA